MKSKRKHINQFLSVLLLMVFSIALTPWNALHHHQTEVVYQKVEKSCTHELHLSNHVDTCLICKAHFVKDFINETATFEVFISSSSPLAAHLLFGSSYVELIQTSLRGPPVATV